MEFANTNLPSSSSSSSSSSLGSDIQSPPSINSSSFVPSLSSPSSTAPTPSPKRKAGRKKFRETRHPVYHGVRERKGGKWVCEVREPNKKNRIWLGTYPTPEMAARAHDVAAIALRGKSAVLNFPQLAWTLPRASSTDPDNIRAAATKAAKMCSLDDQTQVSYHQHNCNSSRTVESVLLDQSSSMESVGRPGELVLDEDEVFNKPLLLDEMARGLLLTPPALRHTGSDDSDLWDDMDYSHMDLSLWNLD